MGNNCTPSVIMTISSKNLQSISKQKKVFSKGFHKKNNQNQNINQNQNQIRGNKNFQNQYNMMDPYSKFMNDNFIVRQNGNKFKQTQRKVSTNEKIDWIRQNVIGLRLSYISPFGLHLEAIYVDHTATNRPFKAIEKMVQYAKLYAANPHTEYSQFGKFSTQLLHYSQTSLLNSFSADQKDFIVIPTGNGSTGAIKHFFGILRHQNIYKKKNKKLTVFITPYEHHSNILPWVQYIGAVEILAHNQQNTLIMEAIQQQLINYDSDNIIVSVSAASNVTSKLTDLNNLNQIIRNVRMKKNKNIIFGVDCAAFCCHHQLKIKQLDQIDMCYFSPHKNLGGSQSCGLLLIRKKYINSKPSFPGGGTVKFVSGYSTQNIGYVDDAFQKEIAGTPPFLGFYRAALSFQLLKQFIGYDFIHQNQQKNLQIFLGLIKQVNHKLRSEKIQTYIHTYGEDCLQKRANIVTFNIFDKNNKMIPYSFASLFMTDVFGIQVRSGCFCAGPYGIELLKISKQRVHQLQQQINAGIYNNKPGYLRLDITFYLKVCQIQYIANALYYICKYNKNLMKLYSISDFGSVGTNRKVQSNDKYHYNLKYVKKVQQTIQNMNKNKLISRQQILMKQLQKGRHFCENLQKQ